MILEALESAGVCDDTFVIFLSDNDGCAEFLAEDLNTLDPVQFDTPMRNGERVRMGNNPEIYPGELEPAYLSLISDPICPIYADGQQPASHPYLPIAVCIDNKNQCAQAISHQWRRHLVMTASPLTTLTMSARN